MKTKTIEQLAIDDERSFRHVGLYADLKEALKASGYRFRVLENGNWDRALLLNLAFWGPDEGGDVLVDARIDADVVMHAAWHHLASRAFGGAPTADALFFGEAIASAFDLYLVGRLLGHSPESSFLATQVPAMSEVCEAAGLSEEELDAMLNGVADDPERAFEDLRQLLFDVTTGLVACNGVEEADAVLERFASHRFGALLHHYALASWVLYARAYATREPDERVRALDRTLREAPVSLDVLERSWLR